MCCSILSSRDTQRLHDLSFIGRMAHKQLCEKFLLIINSQLTQLAESGYNTEESEVDESDDDSSGEESDGTRQIRHFLQNEDLWKRRIARHEKLQRRREQISQGEETSESTSLGMKNFFRGVI